MTFCPAAQEAGADALARDIPCRRRLGCHGLNLHDGASLRPYPHLARSRLKAFNLPGSMPDLDGQKKGTKQ